MKIVNSDQLSNWDESSRVVVAAELRANVYANSRVHWWGTIDTANGNTTGPYTL